MVLTEQCLGPLHLRVLQNTITTTSNLECLLHTGDLCLRECMQLRLYVCGHVDVMVEGGVWDAMITSRLLRIIAIFGH